MERSEKEAGLTQLDDTTEHRAKHRIKQLVHFILVEFLSFATIKATANCREEDVIQRVERAVKFEDLMSEPLPVSTHSVIKACVNQVAGDHLLDVKRIAKEVLPDLGISAETWKDVNVNRIINDAVAKWFVTDFQHAVIDLRLNEIVFKDTEPIENRVDDYILDSLRFRYVVNGLKRQTDGVNRELKGQTDTETDCEREMTWPDERYQLHEGVSMWFMWTIYDSPLELKFMLIRININI